MNFFFILSTHHPTCMVHYLTLVNFGPFCWGGLLAYKKTQVPHPLLHPQDAHNEDHPSGHIFSSSFPPLSHLHTLPLETQIVIGTKNFGNGNGTPFWEHELGVGGEEFVSIMVFSLVASHLT